jgi:hypothetical protein
MITGVPKPQEMTVLITVKTYPLPSEGYQELVCTAGVLQDGSFVRLYPIDYRYRPYWQWYGKYQWVKVVAEKNVRDPRPESYRPVSGTPIRPIGVPLDTKKNWAERKKYVLAKGVQSMCGLQSLSQSKQSLGIIRPKEVTKFTVEPVERTWKPKWVALLRQENLFGLQHKPLEKIPYKFSYTFTCEETGCKGHKMMIEDWEIGELYRNMLIKFKDEATAVQKVKEKFYDQICAEKRDPHFFVGTVLKHGTWVILGAFWPKKE